MNEFNWEPGTLPPGWTRETKFVLKNRDFSGGPQGALMGWSNHYVPRPKELNVTGLPVMITFRQEDCQRVNLWIRWFMRKSTWEPIYDLAHGAELDVYARRFDLYRRAGESDAELRREIQVVAKYWDLT